MKKNKFSIVIRVKNLDICRSFYRDVLILQAPVIDSSFVVVFKLSDDLTLALERTSALYLEHSSSATGWCLPVDSFAGLIERITGAGYPAPEDAVRFGAVDCLRCIDPEGNCFFAYEASAE